MQGPFDLKQGGRGIAVRYPVYLEAADGNPVFWGFTIVIIRVPEIFEESVQALTEFGYDYCLTKTVSPLSEERERLSFSKEDLTNPVTYTFEFGGCTFNLAVTPKDGWKQGRKILPNLVLGFFIVLFLTGLMVVILVIEFHREVLKKIAITDPLTGLLNRDGFDEQIKSAIQDTPDAHCVGIQTDIDDFKFINDMYGHEAGDTALRILAQSMRNAFEKDAILCRNGGDEFSAVLIGMTEAEAKEKSRNSLCSLDISHRMERNVHFIFRLGMQNIRRIVMMYRN